MEIPRTNEEVALEVIVFASAIDEQPSDETMTPLKANRE